VDGQKWPRNGQTAAVCEVFVFNKMLPKVAERVPRPRSTDKYQPHAFVRNLSLAGNASEKHSGSPVTKIANDNAIRCCPTLLWGHVTCC
jgi:hypothetical protein